MCQVEGRTDGRRAAEGEMGVPVQRARALVGGRDTCAMPQGIRPATRGNVALVWGYFVALS